MRAARYEWHPALLRFVVPETPNVLRVRFRRQFVENEWSVVAGLVAWAIGVALGIALIRYPWARWVPVICGLVVGVAVTMHFEGVHGHWIEIHRRSSYWRVTRGKGKLRESVQSFDMDQVTDAEVEQDERGMWLLVYLRNRSSFKLIGRSHKWTWFELEAMREEILCPRIAGE